MKKLLITGANGFIGKNLLFALQDYKVLLFDKEYTYEYLDIVLKDVDFIFHLASGIKEGFSTDLTQFIISSLDKHKNYPPILYTSSIKADTDTEHGRYKRLEEELLKYYKGTVYLYRLANVFGRWARPEYNSVVATFLFNDSYGLPLKINEPSKELSLVYINDVVNEFRNLMEGSIDRPDKEYLSVYPVYKTTVGQLANTINGFGNYYANCKNMDIDKNLMSKLFETYNR